MLTLFSTLCLFKKKKIYDGVLLVKNDQIVSKRLYCVPGSMKCVLSAVRLHFSLVSVLRFEGFELYRRLECD